MSNVDSARTAYQAFAAGDLAAVKDAWADDIHWWSSAEAPPGGERRGVDAVMQLFAEIPEHWTAMTVNPDEFIDAGDYVVVRGTQSLTNGNGSVESRFAHILKYNADGKVIDADMHTDSAKGSKLQG